MTRPGVLGRVQYKAKKDKAKEYKRTKVRTAAFMCVEIIMCQYKIKKI